MINSPTCTKQIRARKISFLNEGRVNRNPHSIIHLALDINLLNVLHPYHIHVRFMRKSDLQNNERLIPSRQPPNRILHD